MFETTPASRISDTLFGPIENRDRADDLARLLAFAVGILAVVEAAFIVVLGPGAIVVAVLEAALAVLVWWKKSIGAAVALLVVALAATVAVVHSVFRGAGSPAAWALVISLIGVWAGGRAVHCTIALRRLRARNGGVDGRRQRSAPCSPPSRHHAGFQ
jgi:hypothetical protein